VCAFATSCLAEVFSRSFDDPVDRIAAMDSAPLTKVGQALRLSNTLSLIMLRRTTMPERLRSRHIAQRQTAAPSPSTNMSSLRASSQRQQKRQPVSRPYEHLSYLSRTIVF
jgi:hypothetical protein